MGVWRAEMGNTAERGRQSAEQLAGDWWGEEPSVAGRRISQGGSEPEVQINTGLIRVSNCTKIYYAGAQIGCRVSTTLANWTLSLKHWGWCTAASMSWWVAGEWLGAGVRGEQQSGYQEQSSPMPTAQTQTGSSHFSVLHLFISSLLHPPACDLEINLKTPS